MSEPLYTEDDIRAAGTALAATMPPMPDDLIQRVAVILAPADEKVREEAAA